MFTTTNSPLDSFIALDDALAELTELSDQVEYQKDVLRTSIQQLSNIRDGLNAFVKDNHGVTDAQQLLESLCDEFALDASRRITATVNVQYTVIVDAPYTKTIDDVELDIAGLDFKVDTIYNIDYDVIDAIVEDIDVTDIDED